MLHIYQYQLAPITYTISTTSPRAYQCKWYDSVSMDSPLMRMIHQRRWKWKRVTQSKCTRSKLEVDDIKLIELHKYNHNNQQQQTFFIQRDNQLIIIIHPDSHPRKNLRSSFLPSLRFPFIRVPQFPFFFFHHFLKPLHLLIMLGNVKSESYTNIFSSIR